MKRFVALLALLTLPALGRTQTIKLSAMARCLSTTGCNDSALTLVTDSAVRTRATTIAQFRKALSVHAFDSLITAGALNVTGATVTGAPTWATKQRFSTGLVITGIDSLLAGSRLAFAANDTVYGQPVWNAGQTIPSLTLPGSGALTTGSISLSTSGTSAALNISGTTSGNATQYGGLFGQTFNSAATSGYGVVAEVTTAASSFTLGTGYAFAAFSPTLGATSIATTLGGLSIGNMGVSGTTTSYGINISAQSGSTTNYGIFVNNADAGKGLYINNGGMTVAAGTSAFQATTATSVGFTTNLLSTTALATPGALSATQFTGFASTVNGAATMGFGTTYDASVLNRAGTVAFGVTANTVNSVFGGNISGTGAWGLTGGAGNMTITSGTGNSRTLALQSTTSGGTATTFLTGNADQTTTLASRLKISDGTVLLPSATFANDTLIGLYRVGTAGASDTLMITANGVVQLKIAPLGILRLPALPSEGSTKNAVCFDGVTFNVTQNAAATCTVSSARFKKNITALSLRDAQHFTLALKPVQYEEKQGGRKAFGLIAEQVDSVDHRLASRDGSGLITSTNYEEVTVLLLRDVQGLHRELDSLRLEVTRLKARKH